MTTSTYNQESDLMKKLLLCTSDSDIEVLLNNLVFKVCRTKLLFYGDAWAYKRFMMPLKTISLSKMIMDLNVKLLRRAHGGC